MIMVIDREISAMGHTWIDLHSHAGRSHDTGADSSERAGQALAALSGIPASPSELISSGMSLIVLALVSDSSVLLIDDSNIVRAARHLSYAEIDAMYVSQLSLMTAYLDEHDLILVDSASRLENLGRVDKPLILMSAEGASFIGNDFARLYHAYDNGIRSIQLMHYSDNIFGSFQSYTDDGSGLTDLGFELIRRMNSLGMIIDLAHANYQTTLDALRASETPVMISHSLLSHINNPHPRFLNLEHAKIICDNGGIIGAWPTGFSVNSLEEFASEILRLVDSVGVDNVGIGTDLDGNYRPALKRYEEFSLLSNILLDFGLCEDEINGILGDNARDFFERVLV